MALPFKSSAAGISSANISGANNSDNRSIKYASIAQAIRSIVRDEGALSLWKGNWSATYLWVAYGSVQFGSFGIIRDVIDDPSFPLNSYLNRSPSLGTESGLASSSSSFSSAFVSGALSSALATITTYPFDIMRTQFAIQGKHRNFESLTSFVSHIYKENGPKGLFVGLVPALAGTLPYMGLNFAIYEYLRVLLISNSDKNYNISNNISNRDSDRNNIPSTGSSTTFQQLMNSIKLPIDSSICGALSGGTSKFIVYPLDTIKRRIQSQILISTFDSSDTKTWNTPSNQAAVGSKDSAHQHQHHQRRYNGILNCAKQIIAVEGFVGLYKGLLPSVLKAVTSTAVAFATFEWVSSRVAQLTNGF